MRGIRATKKTQDKDRVLVDITDLTRLLSCGTKSAKKIAEEAGAVVSVGRRKLYAINKIKRHLEG